MFKKVNKFFQTCGPSLIALEADNDAGAISSYVQCGALYGLKMLWIMFILMPITYFCQMSATKLALYTGEGLITLIKRRLGTTWAKLTLINLFGINFLTLLTEFVAIVQLSLALHINPYISVPASVLTLCYIVSKAQYNKWERIMIVLCCLDLFWILLSVLSVKAAQPDLAQSFNFADKNYLFMAMGLIGTTVAPWQLFFQNSCSLDKQLKFENYKDIKTDTFISSIFTVVVAIGMMLVGVISYSHHINFVDVPTLATSLKSIFPPTICNILYLMVLNASIIGTASVSLSTAWVYTEFHGMDRSLNLKFSEAKNFYAQYYGSVILAGLLALYPHLPLQMVLIGVQVIACIFLPFQLIVIQILSNDKNIMNDQTNSKAMNWAMNIIIGLIIILSIFLFRQVL